MTDDINRPTWADVGEPRRKDPEVTYEVCGDCGMRHAPGGNSLCDVGKSLESPLPADPQIIIDGMTIAHAEAEKHVVKLVRERDELRAVVDDIADAFRERIRRYDPMPFSSTNESTPTYRKLLDKIEAVSRG